VASETCSIIFIPSSVVVSALISIGKLQEITALISAINSEGFTHASTADLVIDSSNFFTNSGLQVTFVIFSNCILSFEKSK